MSRMGSIAPLLSTVVVALLAGCASGPGGRAHEVIHDFTMRERVARVAVGQSIDEARALLGAQPVRRPAHPDDPFPSPLRSLSLVTADGAEVRVDVYVVAARHAAGCPDVHFDDEPVAYVDGVVAGKGWPWVERQWKAWGGALEALRDAQERHQCPWPAGPGTAADPARANAAP